MNSMFSSESRLVLKFGGPATCICSYSQQTQTSYLFTYLGVVFLAGLGGDVESSVGLLRPEGVVRG